MEKLDKYITQTRGVSYKPVDSSDKLKEEFIPLLRANNIKDGKINFENLIFIKKDKVKEEQYLKKGDILVCTSSGSKELVGKAGLIKEDISATFGAFCKVIRCKKGLNEKFLNHFLQSNRYRTIIAKNSKGANINNLRTEDFDNLLLEIIQINKQIEISNKLDKIQEIIDIRKKQIKKLDELIKSKFVEMFGKIEDKVRLKDCCSKITDYVASGSFASIRENVKYYDSPEYAIMVRTADFANNFSRNLTYTDKHGYDFLHNSNLFGGELLLSNIGASIGKVHRVPYLNVPMTLAPNAIMLKVNKEYLEDFLQYYFLSDEGQAQLKSMTTATAMPKFNKTQLKEVEIIKAPIKLQNQFAHFIKLIDKQKFEIQKSLEETQKLQESLMNKYFGG